MADAIWQQCTAELMHALATELLRLCRTPSGRPIAVRKSRWRKAYACCTGTLALLRLQRLPGSEAFGPLIAFMAQPAVTARKKDQNVYQEPICHSFVHHPVKHLSCVNSSSGYGSAAGAASPSRLCSNPKLIADTCNDHQLSSAEMKDIKSPAASC